MTEELYHPLSLDPAAPTLCDGSIVLSTRLILLADLSQCVEWEFLTPGWLVWKPAWAQQNWSASWLPLELQVERGAPAKRLDLALRTDKSGDWLYAGEVTLMSHGWGSGSAPWSGEAHAAFRLSSPLGAGYWPELKHWNLKIDKRESDWSGSIHWPQEVEADWSEIELARRCGDALFLKRTGGRVYATIGRRLELRRAVAAITTGSLFSRCSTTRTCFYLPRAGVGRATSSLPTSEASRRMQQDSASSRTLPMEQRLIDLTARNRNI